MKIEIMEHTDDWEAKLNSLLWDATIVAEDIKSQHRVVSSELQNEIVDFIRTLLSQRAERQRNAIENIDVGGMSVYQLKEYILSRCSSPTPITLNKNETLLR